MRKDKRDKKELRDYETGKRAETQIMKAEKVKNIQKDQNLRASMLSKKHNMLDNRATHMKESLNNYCNAIKESNMFRALDHNENL